MARFHVHGDDNALRLNNIYNTYCNSLCIIYIYIMQQQTVTQQRSMQCLHSGCFAYQSSYAIASHFLRPLFRFERANKQTSETTLQHQQVALSQVLEHNYSYSILMLFSTFQILCLY